MPGRRASDRRDHRSGTTEASPPPWEDFHVYSMEWHPDRIDIFMQVDYVRVYQQQ